LTKRTLEYLIFLGAATFLEDLGLRLIRVLALVYICRILVEVVNLFLRELLLAGAGLRSTAEEQQRRTLLPLAQSVPRYAIYFLLRVMGPGEFGVETAPLIAGAGLTGLALGLGAQAFFSDIVSGLFIFLEGIVLVGDRVQIGEVIGVVEEIGSLAIKIRRENGVLHTIPNGEVRSVANHAARYVNAVVELGLGVTTRPRSPAARASNRRFSVIPDGATWSRAPRRSGDGRRGSQPAGRARTTGAGLPGRRAASAAGKPAPMDICVKNHAEGSSTKPRANWI